MREFKDLGASDLKIALMRNKEVSFSGFSYKCLNLGEISDIGFELYQTAITILTLDMDDIISRVVTEPKKRIKLKAIGRDLKAFDLFMGLAGEEFHFLFLDALSVIFNTRDVHVITSDGKQRIIGLHLLRDGFLEIKDNSFQFIKSELETRKDDIQQINRDNFDDFVKYIKISHFLEDLSKATRQDNFANDEAKRIAEKLRKGQKKVQEVKNEQSEYGESNIADLIDSIITVSNWLNGENIWSETIYGLYREFTRIEIVNGYHLDIKVKLAGVKTENETKHWSK